MGRDERGKRTWSPLLLIAILAGAVLNAGGLAALGIPPHATDSGYQVVAWLLKHHHSVQWYVWTTTAATPITAFIYASLRNMLPAPHRDIFLIGAVILIAVTGIQAWIWGGLALHVQQLDPAIARTVLDVAIYWGPVLTGATTTMIAPVTWLALRRQSGLPLWLGILGAIAFVEQGIETVTIFGSSGFMEPGGAMNLQLGAGLTGAWLVSFALWGAIWGHRPVTNDDNFPGRYQLP